MYPAMKQMDPVHSGTGVYYQAIPAVGADGKNIMKLMPVKMINGQLVNYRVIQPISDPAPQKAAAIVISTAPAGTAKPAALNPLPMKQVSLQNAFPNPVGLHCGNFLSKHPQPLQNVTLMTRVPPMSTPVVNNGAPPPVTMTFVALPKGQCPVGAQVQSVPASQPPPGMRTHTFTSSCPSSGSTSSGHASPMTSVSQVTPQIDADTLKMLCKRLDTASNAPALLGSRHLKLIPKASQRPNSPIKWSIEEAAPTPHPTGPPVTSQILHVVTQGENTEKHCETVTQPQPSFGPTKSSVFTEIPKVTGGMESAWKPHDVSTKPAPGSSHGQSGHGQKNTFVMVSTKAQQQQENVTLMTRAPPVVNNVKQSPVAVHSPALPRGQFHPAGTQIQLVPASGPPPGIKTHTSSASPCPSSGSSGSAPPMTGFVSGDMLKLLCKTLDAAPHPPPLNRSKPHLKLIPKGSQRPNSPIKWSVEEDAPNPHPTDPPLTSEILRVVSPRENAGMECDAVTQTSPSFARCINSSVTAGMESAGKPHDVHTQTASGQGQEKPFAVRKLTLLGQSGSSPSKIGKNSPSAARKKSVPSTQQSAPQKAPDEVIDLCDDDALPPQQAALMQTSHEDGVIFVSYIPPQPESKDLSQKDPEQTGTSSSGSVTQQVGTLAHVVTDQTRDGVERDISSDQSDSTQQIESKEAEEESPKDDSSNEISLAVEDINSMENSINSTTSSAPSLPSESCPVSDNLLRRIFGITADVKICLQKIDEASGGSLLAEPQLKEGELSSQDLNRPQEAAYGHTDVERSEVQCLQELPEPSPSLLTCSHIEPITSIPSISHEVCLSLEGTSLETPIGYVEPIDEDFLSSEDGPHTHTCADLAMNKRRMGRKRKSTTCPCCMPKSSGEQQDKCVWTARKKGGRGAKVVSNKTSGRSNCQRAASTSQDAACLSAASEAKLHEQIMRLKELLQEKEAALERMRTNTLNSNT